MIGKNALIQMIFSVLGALVSFLTLSLSARLFGPEIIGNLAYLLGLAGLIFAFSDLGFSRAHIYFTSAKQAISKTLGTFVRIKLVLLLVTSLLAVVIYKLSGQTYSWMLFGVVLVYEFLSRFSEAILITFEALQKAIPQNLVRLIAKSAKLIAVIIIAQGLRNVFGFSLTFLTQAFVLILLSLWLVRRFMPLKYDRSLSKKYFQYSLPFFAIIPLSYLQTNSLTVILKQFWPGAEVGYYSASANLAGFIKTLYGAVMVFFFPKISSLYASRDAKSIQQYTDLTVKYLLVLFAPLFLIFFLLRQEVVALVLGPEFMPAIPVYSLLLLGMFLLMLFNFYNYVLFATHNHKPLVLVNLISLLMTIALSFIMIPRLGATGAALVNLITWIISGLWGLGIIRKRLQLRIMPCFLNFAVPLVLILLLTSGFIIHFQAGVMLKLFLTLTALFVYLGTIVIFKQIKKEDIKYFISLLNPQLK